ncbi:hypothetical protein F9K97_16495 [Brucella anthropi]|uniref:hypothetical protein n=1 Tax=Brucella anthropi TaxID=529 RepID=UPI00124D7527|nr:hypothetical protein [Brucella anthropi]KAB2784574.1 hypothetical protein F9K97_16495 [Brucella anthropi]
MAETKRDNRYYADLLKRRSPETHAKWVSGDFVSLAAALKAAGIKKTRSPLHELKNGWKKASEAERREFIEWAYDTKLPLSTPHLPTHLILPGPIAHKRYLEEWAKKRIREIRERRGLEHGDIMEEINYHKGDVSLTYALTSGYRLKPALIIALTKWLADNYRV